jgi:hypothetical protein
LRQRTYCPERYILPVCYSIIIIEKRGNTNLEKNYNRVLTSYIIRNG